MSKALIERLRRRLPWLDWRAVLMTVIAALGIIVLIALVANQVSADAERDRALEQQSQSYEVMILTQSFGGTMAEAEAALARYVVSGEENIGRDYGDKWRRAAGQLDLLARRTADNPVQRRRVADLRIAFAARNDELARIAHHTSIGRHQAAYAYFDAARSSPALTRIDQLRTRLFEDERATLARRSARARATIEEATRETGNLILFGALIVACALALGWLNIQAIRARAAAAAEAAVQRKRTEELEAAVAAATAGLQDEARERAAAEAQLRQAQKMEAVGQLTGGIAHDFNNMLAVVLGGIDLAKRHLSPGNEKAARHIDNAAEGARRAAALTRRLLTFARAEGLASEAIEPTELVQGMSDLLERTLGEGINIVTRSQGDRWHVWADRLQLENALLNLAVNARDAMDGRGTLTISTAHVSLGDDNGGECGPGDYVSFAVSDTGSGMTPDVLERVFEPFFTTKPVGKGTGLGLSQIFGFTRQSGGEVRIESTPGEGTTVTLLLPCHAPKAHEQLPPGAEPTPPAEQRPLDILLVEDDSRVLAATLAALQELGHRPVPCEDPLTASDVIADMDALDLIVTDVIMPGRTGPEMIAALEPMLDGVAVLYVTGYAGDASDTNRFGKYPVLRKPFTLSALESAIADAMMAIQAPVEHAAG